MSAAVTQTTLPLPLISRGKVRDIYDAQLTEDLYKDALLIVATDRISAYDVVLANGIPDKGRILHAISTMWFEMLTPHIVPSHVLATKWEQFPADLQKKLEGVREQVDGRAMLVRRAKVLPIEAIVRGYLSGSAWKEYQKTTHVHGHPLAPGLLESQRIPDGPLFTPSTKAEVGEHDENISVEQATQLLGDALAKKVQDKSVALFTAASEFAEQHGLILADTKFEFGLVEDGELIVVDEVLTPDSSRFWPKDTYQVGQSQPSFDKQFVRDWMTSQGLDKTAIHSKEPVVLPDGVVQQTTALYREAYKRFTGKDFA